jgi:hypothetical protein
MVRGRCNKQLMAPDSSKPQQLTDDPSSSSVNFSGSNRAGGIGTNVVSYCAVGCTELLAMPPTPRPVPPPAVVPSWAVGTSAHLAAHISAETAAHVAWLPNDSALPLSHGSDGDQQAPDAHAIVAALDTLAAQLATRAVFDRDGLVSRHKNLRLAA